MKIIKVKTFFQIISSILIIFFASNSFGYSQESLSKIVLDNKSNSFEDALHVLNRCYTWNNMIAMMGSKLNNEYGDKVYKEYFEIALFFYNTIIDSLMEQGMKESIAEKNTQDKLVELDAKYRSDANKNIQKYGKWFEGYFIGETGDANICERYYEKLKN